MQITTQLSGTRIIFYLILIIIISLGLKLYTVDFSIPAHSDDFGYILDSIQYGEGDFFISQKKTSWLVSCFNTIYDDYKFR